jgi:hypothetical protein
VFGGAVAYIFLGGHNLLSITLLSNLLRWQAICIYYHSRTYFKPFFILFFSFFSLLATMYSIPFYTFVHTVEPPTIRFIVFPLSTTARSWKDKLESSFLAAAGMFLLQPKHDDLKT